MSTSDADREILAYLSGTHGMRNYVGQHKLVSSPVGYDKNDTFEVSPWDIQQVCLNTGMSSLDEIRAFVSRNSQHYSIRKSEGGNEIISETGGGTPGEYSSSASDKLSTVSVEDAFKWYLYHKVTTLSEEGSKPVAISDGVFAIKNELFLPDDFVPPVMMEMVEGSKVVDVNDAVAGIQPDGGRKAIFILGKHDRGNFIEPDSFCANASFNGPMPERMPDLGKKILESFEDLQKTDAYSKFLLSRIMRNVVFTVETKKKRELGKPMFDPGKLKVLESNGIVKIDGNVGVVPEDMTVDKLKDIKKEAEELAANVSRYWMKSQIEL